MTWTALLVVYAVGVPVTVVLIAAGWRMAEPDYAPDIEDVGKAAVIGVFWPPLLIFGVAAILGDWLGETLLKRKEHRK